MDVKGALFMNGGDLESSYAQHGCFSQKVTSITKPILVNAIHSLFSEYFHREKVLNVADLGCAAGPNPFSVILTVKESLERKCKELNCQPAELQVYLNDLPGNDFNSLFKDLSGVGKDQKSDVLRTCFVMGAPGSFYGRLFPRSCLHLVHSCYSVHWLSQVPKGLTSKEGLPLNKGKINISKTSPPVVEAAYLAQFKEDFTLLLKSRAEEMVQNGRMVLILNGRQASDPWGKESCYHWEVLAEAISEMVSQGLVDEEKLDSFNVPCYAPSQEEVQDIVDKVGSFAVEHIETFTLPFANDQESDTRVKGEQLAKNIRSFTESIISYEFGKEITEKVYHKLTQIVVKDMASRPPTNTTVVVVLSRTMG
ncbi:IpCS3 [Ilex paraguariensis]|uniref:IpCS3 protein n=1 Tax=Ilex paraguariensis TaxID=185542 RepID=A0ABC8QTJ5_9AQUA